MTFEADVRRVAEAVWHMEPGHCQPTHYENTPVIRELDGIARLRDITHLMMVTTSTKLDKARADVQKLNAAEALEKSKTPAVSKWLITRFQLDAQHVEYARKSNVTVLTFEQFQRRFFDSFKYLSRRALWAFGSARDPHTDSINIAEDAYVKLPITISAASATLDTKYPKNRAIDLDTIREIVLEGNVVVLLAPFGAGKSLTTREIFKSLSTRHKNDQNSPTPFALNLREHWGEDFSDEILDRHARTIGYTPREDVVVAWRAGMACLLIDGFDEVASQTVVRTDDKNFMRDARRRALQGLREFTNKVPAGMGLFICGRDHYFDTIPELTSALGITSKNYVIAKLDEFSEEGAQEFLNRNGIQELLPDWLPRKPLILAYLLRKGLFQEILAIDTSKGFGFAWDSFLTRICEREAELESSVMDPQTLRAVMERLSDSVRGKPSGTGPITGNDLSEAYNLETGQAAGEGVLAQLQRLPGLTQRDSEPGSRSFVDEDMLGALQGGAFSKAVLGSFVVGNRPHLSELSDKAISMATYLLSKNGTRPETVASVAERLYQSSTSETVSQQLIADCIMLALNMAIAIELEQMDFRGVVIDSASIGVINFDEVVVRGVEFRNCTVREIIFGTSRALMNVRFSGCLIAKVSGVTDRVGIPTAIVAENCDIESYDNMSTNNAVMRLDISPQLKALVTILRKLYKQAGAGRKLSALSRGITQPDVQPYIDPVLRILERHRFVSVFNKVVHPVRKQTSRVEKILSAPALSSDQIVIEVASL